DDNFIKFVEWINVLKNFGDLDENNKQFLKIANDIYNKLGELIKCIEDSCNSEIKKQFLCGDDDFITLVNIFKFLKSTITQFFSDEVITNYKFDEWIINLENSGDLDETIKQFLDKDKYGKESSDDHKYKSKYIQKDSNSLLIPLA
ncbi:38466_t:CDS:1, partial [Gigaspora margarita]